MAIKSTLNDVTDQVVEILTTIQTPVVDVVRQVVEAVDGYLPEDRPELAFAEQLPKPAELLDRGFAIAAELNDGEYAAAKKLLKHQQAFAKSMLDAFGPLLPASMKPAPKPKVAKAAAA